MMDLRTIKALNKKYTLAARRKREYPVIPSPPMRRALAEGNLTTIKIPMLGEYVPRGWKLLKTHFVDMSGWGAEDEPAMSQPAFAKLMATAPENHGFGAIEHGQFQIYVGEYERRA